MYPIYPISYSISFYFGEYNIPMLLQRLLNRIVTDVGIRE